MDVEQNICKYCNMNVGDEIIENEKSLEELASELQKSKPQYVMYSEENKLRTSGIIKWLLQNATEKKLASSDIDKIVDECVYSDESDIINILKHNGVFVELPQPIKSKKWYRSAIYFAAQIGTPEIITWILSFKINSVIGEDVLNKLMYGAAENINLNTIIKFIDLGADVDYIPVDIDEADTILDIASKLGSYPIVKWLLNNFDYTGVELAHSLRCAIEDKQYDIIKILVERECIDMNSREIQSSYETFIHLAASTGSFCVVKYLKDHGTDLLAKDECDNSVVHFAAENGNLNLLKWLNTQGAIDYTRECQDNPLHVAAKHGHLDCVQYLVHKNYDVNMVTENGNSVLHFAANSKNIKMVKFLVAHGANPLVINRVGNTLLHSSQNYSLCSDCEESCTGEVNLNLVKLLASYNIDLNAKNNNHETVLHLALVKTDATNAYETSKWLLDQGMDSQILLLQSSRYIHSCWRAKDWRLLYLCIDHMTDINQLINGQTLLFSSASYVEAMQILIDNNADVNIRTTVDEITPLMNSLNDWEDLKGEKGLFLIKHGADVNAVTIDGNSALYYAVENFKTVEVIKKLIELGADVNAGNRLGKFITLHEAVQKGNLDIVQCLVEAGAEVNCKNIYNNDSAITLETDHESKWEIIKYLVENGADANHYTNRPILFDAVQTGDVQLVSTLLHYGANANIVLPNEVSIVHLCTGIADDDSKLEILKLLISNDANINALNANEETILFCCIDNKGIVDYLLQMGIDIFIKNDKGSTALHEALLQQHYLGNIFDQIKIVLNLIHHGSHIRHADANGNTPLHLAVANPHCSEIVRLLVQKGANVYEINNERSSILHETCLGELGMWLISKGANVNSKNNQGMTVLQKAIQNVPKENANCSRNVVTSLVNRCTKNEPISGTTLDSINTSRYIEYVHMLIDKVSDVNITNDDGLCALHYVVPTDNVAILDHLFKKGANLLSRTEEGNTVLHLAASQGSIKIVTYILVEMNHVLLFKGNNANEIAYQLAINSQHINIAKLLLQKTIQHLKDYQSI